MQRFLCTKDTRSDEDMVKRLVSLYFSIINGEGLVSEDNPYGNGMLVYKRE